MLVPHRGRDPNATRDGDIAPPLSSNTHLGTLAQPCPSHVGPIAWAVVRCERLNPKCRWLLRLCNHAGTPDPCRELSASARDIRNASGTISARYLINRRPSAGFLNCSCPLVFGPCIWASIVHIAVDSKELGLRHRGWNKVAQKHYRTERQPPVPLRSRAKHTALSQLTEVALVSHVESSRSSS